MKKLPQHLLLQYWCYDIAIDNMSYEARRKFKMDNISRLCYTFDTYEQHLNNKSKLILLPDVNINNINDATRFRDKFISLGFEGLIVRDTNAAYQFGARNLAMLKYKRVDDAKFKLLMLFLKELELHFVSLFLKMILMMNCLKLLVILTIQDKNIFLNIKKILLVNLQLVSFVKGRVLRTCLSIVN